VTAWSSEDLIVEHRGPAALVTMQGEHRLNAMTRAFWPSLRAVLEECEHDPDVAAVVITGAGTRAFSAGGDIIGYKELQTARQRREFIVDCMRTFRAVESCAKPVIAAVNGVAAGGGCELALACDIVVAAESARFGTPETTIGLTPGFGMVRLVDIVGFGWARYLTLTGELVDAATAARIGLAQEVVPDPELLERCCELAGRIGAAAPLAVATTKALINAKLDAGYFGSTDAVVMLQGTEDATEGIAAFEARRRPKFIGR
jgi:enoyl-CoA hydratase